MCKTQLNSNSIQISVPQPRRAPGIFPFLAANPLSVDQASSNPVRLPTAVRVHAKLGIGAQHYIHFTKFASYLHSFGEFFALGRSYILCIDLILENPGK